MPGETRDPATPPPRPSVFLSYASEDRAAARTLRDTLAAAGLEVWLDEDELGGGEAWDAKIRNQIRTCTYFMPVISATTEIRREGYFRREWRFAVERTLDLADDVMFLVPVVIDGTRDAGARVPEKFFSVQWLRVPGGEATPELRELAGKLAAGEAHAIHPPAPAAAPEPRAGRKPGKAARVAPPFPHFPPYPERGHGRRFIYDIVLWAGHMVHALWMRLPRLVQLIASVVIVFNVISWLARDHDRPAATRADKAALASELAKTIGAAAAAGVPDKVSGSEEMKSLFRVAAGALQAGRPLALVKFGSRDEDSAVHAEAVFKQVFRLLHQNAGGKVSLSPIPLDEDDDDDDALARGTKLESQFVLTGFARRAGPGQPLTFTAKLYNVKERTVVWTETFDAAQVDAAAAARRVTEAVLPLALPGPPAPATPETP